LLLEKICVKIAVREGFLSILFLFACTFRQLPRYPVPQFRMELPGDPSKLAVDEPDPAGMLTIGQPKNIATKLPNPTYTRGATHRNQVPHSRPQALDIFSISQAEAIFKPGVVVELAGPLVHVGMHDARREHQPLRDTISKDLVLPHP
jgi:hypothetical protein